MPRNGRATRPQAGPDQLVWRRAREDRRVLLTASGVFAGAYAIGSVLQAAYVYAVLVEAWTHVEVWQRAAANASGVVALLLALVALRQNRQTAVARLIVGVVVSAIALAAFRVLGQLAFRVYLGLDRQTTTAELVAGFIIGLVSAGVGTAEMLGRRVIRHQAAANERLAVENVLALRALEDEEVRVRRDVAEGLHASAQQHLVMVVARLDDVTSHLAAREANRDEVAVLEAIRRELDEVREQDVRGISRLLYPDLIQVGLLPAVRAMLRRVPSSIAVRLDVDAAVQAADDPAASLLAPTERLLAARVVEEGVGNALRHAHPGRIEVSLGLAEGRLTVAVRDDGGGFDAAATDRSGTRRLAERLVLAGGELELESEPGAGTVLRGRLPVAEAAR